MKRWCHNITSHICKYIYNNIWIFQVVAWVQLETLLQKYTCYSPAVVGDKCTQGHLATFQLCLSTLHGEMITDPQLNKPPLIGLHGCSTWLFKDLVPNVPILSFQHFFPVIHSSLSFHFFFFDINIFWIIISIRFPQISIRVTSTNIQGSYSMCHLFFFSFIHFFLLQKWYLGMNKDSYPLLSPTSMSQIIF